MAVKMVLHPFLNEGRELQVEVNGNNVGACLKELIKLYPPIEKKIFEPNGKLKGYIEVLVNSKSIYPAELSYPINDGDVIDLIVFLSGG